MGWFLELPLLEQIAIIYIVMINILTFFYFGWDKMRSLTNKRRVSEKMLWILTLTGGSVGAIIGMRFFRHKTQKLSFQAMIAVILAVQIWIIVMLFF